MAFSLSRNAKLYLSTVSSSWDGNGTNLTDANTYEIPILDGFSFSQATGTQTVTLNETGTTPRRGQRMFNTSAQPVEWSFSTYLRPFTDSADSDAHSATEKLLWAALVSDGASSYPNANGQDGTHGIDCDSSNMTISMGTSNVNQLMKLYGYFHFNDSGLTYLISELCVDSVTIDFDIDGIATANWTGYGTSLTEVNTAYPDTSGTDYVPANTDADFILNRLSTLTMTGDIVGSSKAYTFPITGGSFTFSNNISYTTPEELGEVNQPVDHQTGTRAISGSFTAYLDSGGTLDSEQLYADMLTDLGDGSPNITQSLDIDLKIGGATAPYVQLNIDQAHIEIPTTDVADVIGLTINFTGLETALGQDNEMTIEYVGAANT